MLDRTDIIDAYLSCVPMEISIVFWSRNLSQSNDKMQ